MVLLHLHLIHYLLLITHYQYLISVFHLTLVISGTILSHQRHISPDNWPRRHLLINFMADIYSFRSILFDKLLIMITHPFMLFRQINLLQLYFTIIMSIGYSLQLRSQYHRLNINFVLIIVDVTLCFLYADLVISRKLSQYVRIVNDGSGVSIGKRIG